MQWVICGCRKTRNSPNSYWSPWESRSLSPLLPSPFLPFSLSPFPWLHGMRCQYYVDLCCMGDPNPSLTDANAWIPHMATLQLPIGSSVERMVTLLLSDERFVVSSSNHKPVINAINGTRMTGHGGPAGIGNTIESKCKSKSNNITSPIKSGHSSADPIRKYRPRKWGCYGFFVFVRL